jgi:hypothetical protein
MGWRWPCGFGAALGNMREAWWVPMVDVWDHEDGPRLPWLVNRERTRRHSIIVNRAGRRFTNEAVNDNAFGSAFHEMHTTSLSYVNRPAWLLFDQHYAVTYGLAGRFRGRAGAGLAHLRTDPGRLGRPARHTRRQPRGHPSPAGTPSAATATTPREDREPPVRGRSSMSTARPSPGCTQRATPWPHRWA